MIWRAPGKLVLSGAYVVLEGAPCIVTAVDRYAIADDAREGAFVTDEVRAAMDAGVIARAPWFDASALRETDSDGTSRKLGLGSSAAILAASLGACLGGRHADERAARAEIFPLALRAHRKAQGGGSGVDVAASTFGGTLVARLDGERLDGERLEVAPHHLPEGIVVEVFASSVSAVTRDLLRRVRELAARDPETHRRAMAAAAEGARAALEARDISTFVQALDTQFRALGELGDAAGAPIVTPDVAAVRDIAAQERAVFGPSGAGGGDISIFAGPNASSPAFREAATAQRLRRVELRIGASGAGLITH